MTELLLDYLTPESLGLDSKKFPTFRDIQLDAIERVTYSDKRFIGLCCPTGSGKELIAMGLARHPVKRTVILTHTKGLQAQYNSSHESFGLVDIRGRDNYECPEMQDGSCRDGLEYGCALVKNGCTHERQRDLAMVSDTVISNYAYWITANDKGAGLERTTTDEEGKLSGHVEQLVLDEGHYAPEALSSYIGFRLIEKEVSGYIETLKMGDSIADWSAQAKLIKEDLLAELRTLRMELTHVKSNRSMVRKLMEMVKHTQALYDKMWKLSWATEEDWVCEKSEGTKWGRVWQFDVIWPGRYAEKYLFCGVPKVVLMSATLRPKTMGLLGLSKDDYEFHEWSRIFPANRNPVYYYPPVREGKVVKVSRKSSDEDLKFWVEHMDRIMEAQLDRRILLITTSYAYQRFIRENSKHERYIVGNDQDPESDSAMEVFEKFIVTKPPVILCSPSFGTGWDFRMDRGELLIVSKIPLRPPASASKLMAKRLERDPEYSLYETAQDLSQWVGRLMRSEKDRGMVVICDGSWGFFKSRAKHLMTKGFADGVRVTNKVPEPMERLLK